MNKKIIKILSVIFLVILMMSIPLVVNIMVLNNYSPFGLDLAGKTELERSWLNFWASYFGCVFSSIITFVVLYLTLRNNDIQNAKNREDAHNENILLRDVQNKRFQYDLSLKHVSEIRSAAVLMYLSLFNSKVDTIYTRILLDRIEEINRLSVIIRDITTDVDYLDRGDFSFIEHIIVEIQDILIHWDIERGY